MNNYYQDGTKVILHSTSDHILDGLLGRICGAVKLNNSSSSSPDLYIVELPFLYNGYSSILLTSACVKLA